ncbi:glutathione hydrolase 1 proenzyme isoform X2 [Strongylocentrotus purpuratus]|nr:glutathione hydrolase 1 proenzyme isoform X2 [Strongylocentrotus purpuratus]XP_030844289.1 glutathione hydrolase 1 proenzyme isoform X2 [Strongylocentrotus purpuratus]
MRSKGANDQKSSVYQNAAVVTDTEICSTMGKDILERGGSAVDAAITSQLCIGLVNGQSSGLGGGFFMVIYDAANATSHFIDARETAPAGANEAYVASRLAAGSPTGINSTAVPGEVRGLWDAHQKYGKLPWEDLFTPVIDLAEKGYRASAHLEDTLRKMELVKPLSDYDGAWDIYLREDGSRKREGDLVINIALANTLRAISVNGSDEFYTGATAQKLIDEVEELGGILTLRDLSSYSTRSGNALTSPIRDGMMLLAPPSPSGGAVLQFIVNVMSSFNLTREDFQPGPNLVRTYHRFLEASRFGFGLRSRTGDEETPGVQQALDALASIDYAREIAASIPTNRVYSTNSSYYNVMPQITTTLGGTSHVNVLAANGDAVSSTTSVNYRFGSKIRSGSTGIIYNNEMSDFSYDSASPNYARPGKRPLSAMCGSIVIDREGRVQLVEGSAGSKKIITVNAWVILSTMLGEVPLSQAVDGKLIHAELRPDIVEIYESGFDQDMIDQLTTLGHDLTEQKTIFAVIQAIMRSDDEIHAYSDPRKGGKPAGY